jgi:hypothetical protein
LLVADQAAQETQDMLLAALMADQAAVLAE